MSLPHTDHLRYGHHHSEIGSGEDGGGILLFFSLVCTLVEQTEKVVRHCMEEEYQLRRCQDCCPRFLSPPSHTCWQGRKSVCGKIVRYETERRVVGAGEDKTVHGLQVALGPGLSKYVTIIRTGFTYLSTFLPSPA